MSTVWMRFLDALRLSVVTMGVAWEVWWGKITDANMPVLVNNRAPTDGRPPNCFTEHANLTCWYFSVYNDASFFSEFQQT